MSSPGSPVLMSTDDIADNISQTAFLVAVSRSRLVEVSGDRFAHLWVSEEAEKLHSDYCDIVSPPTDMVVSIRNRFFLEKLRTFLRSNANPVIVNFGAGFTNYPFLMDGDFDFIEIDFPHVITHKQERLKQWQAEGQLPNRKITFCQADFCDDAQIAQLEETLLATLRDRPSIIILEAVVYYLTKDALVNIFKLFESAQSVGSSVVLNYWLPRQLQSAVFQRQQTFFEKRLGRSARDYLLLEKSFFDSLGGYTVVEHRNAAELENEFCGSRTLADPNEVLSAEYVTMVRESR